MTQEEYSQLQSKCWEEFNDIVRFQTHPSDPMNAFFQAFDRAYALGKEKETITQEDVEKAAKEAVRKEYLCEKCAWNNDCDLCGGQNTAFDCCECPADSFLDGFKAGANFALGKQEKDAEKKSALTGKEVHALESAISELGSLMDGTLDEDYHKEQKSIINTLKRIIKKYEKK